MLSVWREGISRPYRDVVEEVRAQVALAEQAGFASVWLQEHHFDGEGYDVSPNPVLLGADLGARTSKIRICMGAASAPLWHPLRLAEDVAMLDNFTGGRVDVALSRGLLAREIMTLNPRADRRDKERSLALYTESVQLLKAAWTEEGVQWDGEFFTAPDPGHQDHATWFPRNAAWRAEDGEQVGIAVVPEPLQKPHPPLYAVTESADGAILAAQLGMRMHTWQPCGGRLTALMEVYRNAWREAWDVELDVGENFGLLRPCLVAETEEAARAAMEPAVNLIGEIIGGIRGKRVFADDGEPIPEEDDGSWFDFLLERDHLLIGTPESVAERMLRLRDQHGIEHFLCWTYMYGVQHADVIKSLELFGEHVLPELGVEVTSAPGR